MQDIEREKKFGYTVGCLFEKATGKFMGRAGLGNVPDNTVPPQAEIDCYLLPEFWRQHFGFEICFAAMEWGFKNFGIGRIVATINQININAKMLAEELGMRLIGTKPYLNGDLLWYESTLVFSQS